MRIIGGRLKGTRLNPPSNLPVRPTTDLAKEALFNILYNRFDFEQITVLDLFSGTGNISLEFASRGVQEVFAVDKSFGCFQYLKNTAKSLDLPAVHAVKADALKFLKQHSGSYHIVFADPPYDLPQLPQLPQLIFEKKLVKPEGILVLEHPSTIKVDHHPQFQEQRKYGYSSFSIFGKAEN